MYCIDSLQRINDQAVDRYQVEIAAQAAKLNEEPDYNWRDDLAIVVCDYCDQPATEVQAVYNPADDLRDVSGAYEVVNICDACRDSGYLEKERFWCHRCGKLFVEHHSWDFLGAIVDGDMYCQACALEYADAVPLSKVFCNLLQHSVGHWLRLSNIPGHDLLWEGEFSWFQDFPGHTSAGALITDISESMKDQGYDQDTMVYPVITHTYQFSLALAIFAGKEG